MEHVKTVTKPAAIAVMSAWLMAACPVAHRPGDRGFRTENLLIIDMTDRASMIPRQNGIAAALGAAPGVERATLSDRTPGNTAIHTVQVTAPNHNGPPLTLAKQVVGLDYFETYGMSPLAGRVFRPGIPADDRAGETDGDRIPRINAVISVSAAHVLGYESAREAVGKEFYVQHRRNRTMITVIGVVPDVNFLAAEEPLPAEFYILDTHGFSGAHISLRYRDHNLSHLLSILRSTWQRVAPDIAFSASTAQSRLDVCDGAEP